MKVTSSEIEGNQVVLEMEIEAERVEKAMDRAYRRIVSRVNIPGFRRGKAPRVLLERVVGREALMDEALEILIPEAYKEAVRETGIDPVDNPKVDVVSAEPLSVRATVPVRPKVQLGDYRAIRQSLETPEVSEEEVDRSLENLRQSKGQWVPVEREAAAGDQVTVDMRGRVEVGDRTFVDTQGIDFVLDPERQILAPGVVEQLIGSKAGDRKAFDVTLPEDFQDRDIAGHEAAIEATVAEVKEKQLPELDDDLAKSVGEFASVADLRAAVRKELESQTQIQARRNLEESVLAAVVDQAVAEPPLPWVEEQAEMLAQETREKVTREGLTFEQFLRFSNRTEESFKEEMLAAARRQLKRTLVLDAVAEQEQVEVTDEDLDAAVEQMVALRGGKMSDADRQRLRTSFRANLRERKTVGRLVEIALGGKEGAEPVPELEPAEASGAREQE